ncbi:DUF55-domain-containing protein [Ceratobasidium sp. AG-I]|nr:DUF55-domain-containing protein [Ceratobasidium sp. AG-I]
MLNFWLMKAEPEPRIVKGKDVKFSVDDFESCSTTAWEGVRNHEAKNIMRKEMKVGDQVFFYHSNCKTPGIAAIAEVSKEAYPDFTANDPTHPYYDAKSSSKSPDAEPTWWMVELTFRARLENFVPLSVLRLIASSASIENVVQLGSESEGDSPSLGYLTPKDLAELKAMPLMNRGRLSVQPVNAGAWAAIIKLGARGGWKNGPASKSLGSSKPPKKAPTRTSTKAKKREPPEESENQAPSQAAENEHSPDSQPRRSKRLRS